MDGLHDVLLPAGPQAAALFDLWVVMLIACAVVFAAMMALLLLAVRRAPRATANTAPDVTAHPQVESKMRRAVIWSVGASSALLGVLLLASFMTDRAIARLPLDNAVRIELVAHQFWWEAHYDATDPARTFTTANELHVPVGRPVLLTLRADDVIHSFWVPSLHGKKDLIPGRESTFAFLAEKTGTYRGQCAEFCGYQHAHMALFIFADTEQAFEDWVAIQRSPGEVPRTEQQRRGLTLVESSTCGMCHRIAGTRANGMRAPDLTHVGSRTTLGAGAVVNRDDERVRWIADPHAVKPGVNMPPTALVASDLAALSAYLGSLR